MPRARLFVLGAILVAVQPSVASAHGSDPADYRWVRTPDGVDANAGQPSRREVALLLTGGPTSVWTADLQVVLDLDGSAYADVVEPWIEIVPVDPADLPALPGDPDPVGNAYEITVRAGRSGPVQRGAEAGTVRLALPHRPDDVFVSVDGEWAPSTSIEVFDSDGLTGALVPFRGSAVYLAAATHGGSGLSGAATGAFVAAPVVVLGALTWFGRRRRAPTG